MVIDDPYLEQKNEVQNESKQDQNEIRPHPDKTRSHCRTGQVLGTSLKS